LGWGEGDWRLRSDTHCAFEVVALAVLDQVVHDKHAEEEDDGLEALEVQRHRLVDDPAQDDQERGDEERDLHAAADGDVDCEIHLALVRDNDGCDMLGCVADDRQEDQTDEGLADVRGLDNRVDAVDQILCTNRYQDGNDHERDACRNGREHLAFFLLLFTLGLLSFHVGLLSFHVEEMGVGVELEVEV